MSTTISGQFSTLINILAPDILANEIKNHPETFKDAINSESLEKLKNGISEIEKQPMGPRIQTFKDLQEEERNADAREQNSYVYDQDNREHTRYVLPHHHTQDKVKQLFQEALKWPGVNPKGMIKIVQHADSAQDD